MESVAKLNNVPTSPRKMRMVADMIRGQKVNKALNILKFQPNYGAAKLEKLLLSAISNWQNKHEDVKIEEAELYIKEIFVDSGRMLKRVRPAPQGRAYRVRKRSNHVTLILASKTPVVKDEVAAPQKETKKIKKEKKKE
jgi:large subunit ribosomal protein L22